LVKAYKLPLRSARADLVFWVHLVSYWKH